MDTYSIDWSKKHILKLSNNPAFCSDEDITPEKALDQRKNIEPWLSAIFQSEHFSLLIGTGLTNAICYMAGVKPQDMGRLQLTHKYKDFIKSHAESTAKNLDRGEANIEDDIRSANELITGLKILQNEEADKLRSELDTQLYGFIGNVLKTENEFYLKLNGESNLEDHEKALRSFTLLKSFLLSFASRAASRERLAIFTTNYDRFIELGADDSGIILLDRFKGKLTPIFRNTRLELDYHYNPPGIRGEPRYVEGVVRMTKLHGSIDWRFDHKRIVRCLLPFGADISHPDVPQPIKEGEKPKNNYQGVSDRVVIYPNSSKDIETSFYPYAELFRDFSSAICRPNSVIVTYGYGFGDSHINRNIEDMLTIPSTHLVIIAWDKRGEKGDFGGVRERIKKFYDKVGNSAQFTLLLGEHFADLETLVDYYLPKSTIDRITIRKQRLVNERGEGKNIVDNDTLRGDAAAQASGGEEKNN
jgi:hypothetical protein